jgi:hypothetical protein
MKKHLVRLAAAALIGSACTSSPAGERALPEVAPAITNRGETIYFGRVFPLEGASAAPTYVYERRVGVEGDGKRFVSTHVTRDSAGVVQIAEAATHDATYTLNDYTLYGNQLGESGSVQVEPGQVTFRLSSLAGERTRVEQTSGDVVVGPTLIGVIVNRFEALQRGDVASVRFAVVGRLETIGFELTKVSSAPGELRVKMSPSDFLVGLVVDPIYFTFDSSTKKLLRMEGRVPPLVRDGDDWRDFDARVEYAFVAPSYR